MVKIGVFWPKIDLFGVKNRPFWGMNYSYLGEIPKKGQKRVKIGVLGLIGPTGGIP